MRIYFIAFTRFNIKYFTNKNNWYKPSLYECGWAESVEIDGIGRVRAKFDTGNGIKASTLHAEKINIEDGMVSWNMTVNNSRPNLESMQKSLGLTQKSNLIQDRLYI